MAEFVLEDHRSKAIQPSRADAAIQVATGVLRGAGDTRWLMITSIALHIVMLLVQMLVIGVLLILGNTIRLAIESRREEIVIVKLVGGSDAFVRRPFLYTGFWYGLGGALVAWLAGWKLNRPSKGVFRRYWRNSKNGQKAQSESQ